MKKLDEHILDVLRTNPGLTAEGIFSALERVAGVGALSVKAIGTFLKDNHHIVDFDGRGWLLRKEAQSTGSVISQLKRELELAEEVIRKQRAENATLKRELESYRHDQDHADQPGRDELEEKIAELQRQVEKLMSSDRSGVAVQQPRAGFSPQALHLLETVCSHLAGASFSVRKLIDTSPKSDPVTPGIESGNKLNQEIKPPLQFVPTVEPPKIVTPAPPETVAETGGGQTRTKVPWLIAALQVLGKANAKQIAEHSGRTVQQAYVAFANNKHRLNKHEEPGKPMMVSIKEGILA